MLHVILHTVFSVEYLLLGITIAAMLDVAIHYTKVTTRFTLLEIWGCIVCWPAVLLLVALGFIHGRSK